MKKLILCILICIVIAGGYFFFGRTYTASLPGSPSVTPEVTGTGATPAVQDDWQTFRYPELGYTISIPGDFIIEPSGSYSKLFRKKVTEGVGPTNFVYVSVVPNGKENEEGTIYNYHKSDFEKLVRSQPGALVTLGDSTDENLNMYFRYSHSENRMVGGFGAKGFKNIKPWEFPAGTTEYRFIIETSRAQFIIGGYTGGNISRDVFDQILASIQVTPDTVALSRPTQASGQWKTFTDASEGISFQYPPHWTVRENGQMFPDGDVFSAVHSGATQRTQTELYDGAAFAVMKPRNSVESLDIWMKQRYEPSEHGGPENKPVYSKETYGGKIFDKAYVCGLGCFSYYHVRENGVVYGFVYLAEGPNKAQYDADFKKIMESLHVGK